MNKTELLNKMAQNPEERLILARILDKLESTRSRNIPSHTHFLTLAEQQGAGRLLDASGHPRHLFFGGFEGAERQICVFLPDWMEAEDWASAGDCPVVALHLHPTGGGGLSHRDYLGSILGLGITREKIGDLLVTEAGCSVLLLADAVPILESQLSQVGRQRVTIKPVPLDQLEVPQQAVKVVRDTVATLRLDAVAASGFSTSRAKMSSYINSKKVQLNGADCDKVDRIVAEGDIFVCRGLGKCRLTTVLGNSKKGRIMIEMERYV